VSTWFVLMSVFAAVNPARVAASLAATQRQERAWPLAVGSVVAASIVVLLGSAANAILEFLDITDETWRIAAGVIAVLAGARHLALRAASPLPPLIAPAHALAPVAFPLLLGPEVVVLALLYGATEPLGRLITASFLAFAAVIAWGRADDGPVNRGIVRLVAALLIAAGIALVVAGIRDV